MRKAIGIVLLVFLTGQPVVAGPCATAYVWLKEGTVRGTRLVGRTVYHGSKGAFYGPVVFPLKGGTRVARHARKEGWRALRHIPKTLWEDKFHALGWGILALLQQTTGITHNQFEDDTEDFEVYGGDGIRILVDAFPDNDPLYAGAGTALFQGRYAGKDTGQKVFLIQAKSFEEMRAQILDLIRAHGPVSHVDYLGHGFPGILDMEKGDVYNPGWAEPGFDFSINRWNYTDDKVQIQELQKGFLPNAKFRFTSCFTMRGEGQDAMCQLGHFFMGRNGGTIYGSKVQILPNPVEIAALKLGLSEPPTWLKSWGDLLGAPQGLITTATSVEVGNLHNERQYAFANRTAQREIQPASPEVRDYQDNSNLVPFMKEMEHLNDERRRLLGLGRGRTETETFDLAKGLLRDLEEKKQVPPDLKVWPQGKGFLFESQDKANVDQFMESLTESHPGWQLKHFYDSYWTAAPPMTEEDKKIAPQLRAVWESREKRIKERLETLERLERAGKISEHVGRRQTDVIPHRLDRRLERHRIQTRFPGLLPESP